MGVLYLFLFLIRITLCFAIIMMRKRKLVAMLVLSFGCLITVYVLWHFITVPWVGLQCRIVVFPYYTHLLFVCEKQNRYWKPGSRKVTETHETVIKQLIDNASTTIEIQIQRHCKYFARKIC